MKKALISVSDKTGIVEFAYKLSSLGYEIISTGGTKKILDGVGIKTKSISEITGFPEILDGRVKTLHPKVHGGLLALRDNESHIKELNNNKIEYIDLVCVNLYPFKKTIDSGLGFDAAIENIDIGGPSMLRSAAKNHKYVTVVTDKADYSLVLKEIEDSGDTSLNTRLYLASKVFSLTAQYDSFIANYLLKSSSINYKDKITISYDLKQDLRYGENPHQSASLYSSDYTSYSICYSKQIQGKELSYNNIQDANAGLNLIREFEDPCVIALKHMNPCGVAISSDIVDAWEKAYKADPVSIYGGIVIINRNVTKELALAMKEKKVFLEVIVAPSYDNDALLILSKRSNCRIIQTDMETPFKDTKQYLSINGGLLVQDIDNKIFNEIELEVVTSKAPSKNEFEDLKFAFKVCKHVKSNAIVVANDLTAVGIGAGQMNRVGSAKLAMEWAKSQGVKNMVMASDAFFPFDDSITYAKSFGVTSIIQPGGSIRDEEVISKCNQEGISMVFTKMRHFKH